MRDKKVLEMTMIAMFAAIIAIMSFVPWLGYITVGLAAITIIHIPVILGGIIGGRRVAIVLATVFGVLSMIRAFMTPDGLNVFFQNPVVSVLPRVLFGVALYYIYVGVEKLLPRKEVSQEAETSEKVVKHTREIVALGLAFGLSSLAHSMLVVPILYAFATGSTEMINIFEGVDPDALTFIWAVLAANGFLEAVLAVVIGAPVAWRVRAFYESQIAVYNQE